ncbi:MAG: efflux RND transporter permease subunit [Bacillota bacterium]
MPKKLRRRLWGGDPVRDYCNGKGSPGIEGLADIIKKQIASVEGTRDVESGFERDRPELKVSMDREKAALYGVNTSHVLSALRISLQGQVVTKVKIGGSEREVRLKVSDDYAGDVSKLENLVSYYF